MNCVFRSESKKENESNSQEQQKVSDAPRSTTENPWKSRQAAELFNGQEAPSDSGRSNLYNSQSQRSYTDDRRGYNKRPDSQSGGNRGYNRDGGNRGDRRGDSRGGYRQNDNRGGGRPERPYKPYNEPRANDEVPDIGINNKFAHLQVDVDEVE